MNAISPATSSTLYSQQENFQDNLFRAVGQQDIQLLKRLLSLGFSPCTMDSSGLYLLEFAISHLHQGPVAYEIIELLVSKGAYITSLSMESITIFEFAFSVRNYTLLYILHKYYIPFWQIRQDILGQFLESCTLQDFEFVSKYYPDLQILMVSFMLCKYSHIIQPSFVLASCSFWFGTSFRLITTTQENIRIYDRCQELLIQNIPSYYAYMPLALIHTPELTEKLLKAGVDSNLQDPLLDMAALHLLALGIGNLDCLPLLLDHGANPLLCNKNQQTPIQIAKNHDPKFLETVLERGKALPRPPLHQAALEGNVEKIQQLCSRNPQALLECDMFGDTPLRAAIRYHV
jgi:ankyrin repeat protein